MKQRQPCLFHVRVASGCKRGHKNPHWSLFESKEKHILINMVRGPGLRTFPCMLGKQNSRQHHPSNCPEKLSHILHQRTYWSHLYLPTYSQNTCCSLPHLLSSSQRTYWSHVYLPTYNNTTRIAPWKPWSLVYLQYV